MKEFKPLRYDEDYSDVRSDSIRNWYKKSKFIALDSNGKFFLSLGGDIRFQYFYCKNEGWGDEPQDDDGYVLSRWLMHADLHLGKHFRTFVELQSSLANSRISPSPVDENPLDLHQCFADIEFKLSFSQLIFRIGRQEMLYGSQRLVSTREGPNNRQSFDAMRIIFNSSQCRTDVFYSYYVYAQKGIFDDAFSKRTGFWGAYTTFKKIPLVSGLDVYYLGLNRERTVFDDGIGIERRHSIGTRVWKNKGNWKIDVEALYQFGKFTEKDIKAGTASINTSYQWPKVKGQPQVGIKTEIISGDKNYGDNTLQTFNPMFPKGAYFGLAALIGPLNLVDVHPYIAWHFSKKSTLDIDYDLFWRKQDNDGLYAVNTSLIYSGRSSSARKIGDQVAASVNYQPSQFLYFRAELTWFNAGQFLKEVGTGKDILFTGVTAQLKF